MEVGDERNADLVPSQPSLWSGSIEVGDELVGALNGRVVAAAVVIAFEQIGESLPSFRYHPDPIGTDSVIRSDTVCVVCGQVRGFMYQGPTYGPRVPEPGRVCPWCISDGSAARTLDAQFTDLGSAPNDLLEGVRTELLTRNPGFSGWQDSHWMYHCDDAAAYLGRVGYDEVKAYPDAVDVLLQEGDSIPGSTSELSKEYVESLDRDGAHTAYLFRCLACGKHLAYSDMN